MAMNRMNMESGAVPYALFVGQTKIAVHSEHLHRGVEQHLVHALREKLEGKYVQGSYVRRNSAAILKRSPLVHVQGDPRGTYVATVDYIADRVVLHPRDRILCRIDALNKLSAMGRAGDYMEVKVFLPRDQYDNARFFDHPSMGVGANVALEIMPSPEGSMNQPFVIVYGKIIGIVGDAGAHDGDALPAAARKTLDPKELELGGAGEDVTLGEVAPSLSVVRLAHQSPTWENVLQGLLKRGASMEDVRRGLQRTSPFSRGLDDRRFWWELVQRTPLWLEEMSLSCTLYGGKELHLQSIQEAVQILAGASPRLPGEFHHVALPNVRDHVRAHMSTVALVVDPALMEEDENRSVRSTLTTLVRTEHAYIGHLLSGLQGLEQSGSMVAVMQPRPTQMMVDWIAWLGAYFREMTLLRPMAIDPLHPVVLVHFEGYQGMSEKRRKKMLDVWNEWQGHLDQAQFVSGLQPSAPALLSEAWSQFLDRVQRGQVRAVRDALRIWEDAPDAEEVRELEERVQKLADDWRQTFRFPDLL